MKVYVAGKFEEAPAVRVVQQLLREAGFEISYDWTTEDASPYSGEALQAYKRECALADYKGVREAHFVVALNHPNCFGAMVEIGMALGQGKPVLLIGPNLRENIFWHLPAQLGMRLFDTAAQAVAYAARM